MRPGKKKGAKKTGGRKKGTPNKATVAVKQALTEAFDKLGGVPALVKWASTPFGRTEFYKLWARMLPQEVEANVGGTLTVEITEEVVTRQTDDPAPPGTS